MASASSGASRRSLARYPAMPRWKGVDASGAAAAKASDRCALISNWKAIAGVGSHQAMPGKPVILAVDDDPLALDRVGDELSRRYGRDYEVISESSADRALARIQQLAESGER